MRFRTLGNSEIDISVISLGTRTFGEQNSSSDSFKLMVYATEKGVNYFDTA
jgi:aryl-alcohol dehydrogenase-like predicted oxidoreductase